MEKREETIATAKGYRQANTVWTNGSRLGDKKVGAAFVWQPASGWSGRRFNLSMNKEVLDAEVLAIYQALLWIEGHRDPGPRATGDPAAAPSPPTLPLLSNG